MQFDVRLNQDGSISCKIETRNIQILQFALDLEYLIENLKVKVSHKVLKKMQDCAVQITMPFKC